MVATQLKRNQGKRRPLPERIEFWMQKPFRRHERILYERTRDGWQKRWHYL
jgi:pyridoxine/pyridoxamine 5'-phosphate oxidase